MLSRYEALSFTESCAIVWTTARNDKRVILQAVINIFIRYDIWLRRYADSGDGTSSGNLKWTVNFLSSTVWKNVRKKEDLVSIFLDLDDLDNVLIWENRQIEVKSGPRNGKNVHFVRTKLFFLRKKWRFCPKKMHFSSERKSA